MKKRTGVKMGSHITVKRHEHEEARIEKEKHSKHRSLQRKNI